MARVYMITEVEMQSLIDQLQLARMSDANVLTRDSGDYDKPATLNDVHRAFHFVAVRWAQSVGFKGHR